MRRIVLIAGLLVSAAMPAQADTFVWKDKAGGYTMSFPDSWQMQTVDSPATRLRIAGPLVEDGATCRLQVWDDGRLKIYPKRLMDEAVSDTLTKDYWDGEVGQYQNGRVVDYYAPTSLGDKGDATAVHVSFVQSDGKGKSVPMYGTMIGSIYGGKRYVASCSSRHEDYERYADLFGSILGSVELDAQYHPFATGYYRNFLADPKLVLPRAKPGTVAEAEPGWGSKWFSWLPWFGDKYHR